MFIFSGIFLLLMCTCLALGWRGLEKVYTAQKEAKVAFTIHKNLQDLMISYEHVLMVVHDYIILGEQEEKQTYRINYDSISSDKEDLKNLIAREKGKHCKEFQTTLIEVESSFLDLEKDISQFENTVNEIFTIDKPFGNPKVGSLMKEMDSIVKKLVSQLSYDTLALRELFEHALMECHRNHLFINIILIILGLISFVIGFIVSQYMIKIL